jgi:hypothetical protein
MPRKRRKCKITGRNPERRREFIGTWGVVTVRKETNISTVRPMESYLIINMPIAGYVIDAF